MRPIPLYGEPISFRDLPLRLVPPTVATASPTEVLTAAELEIDAAVAARLILLLGCSAGSGRVLQADEPASLAETFLHIGAVSVIAPAWASDVEATTRWVDAFADAWIGTDAPTAIAVRQATRQLINDGYGLERAGALTLRGDWL
jgi:CHAT domain-containing protein